ncbi:hypothetical protein V8C42DRAFT_322540 [Trichoderma barbatum]
MALAMYPLLPHEHKLIFVRKMALASDACWRIQFPEPPLIGELIASEINRQITLSVGPDRYYSLGGPFYSVRGYLRAYIRYSFAALEKDEGIEQYKSKYLSCINDFVNNHLDDIPAIVESIPIVAMHADMGPRNVTVSNQGPTDIEAIVA